jgi:ABC-2 type transport system permease protein
MTAGAGTAYRVELAKLWSQLAVRVLLALCALAPLGFALVMRLQTAVPADTLFGRWARTTGFATSLTLLGFAGTLGLPLIAGVLSGDVFASEDRYGTWKTILTRSCSRGQVFAGKAAASATAAVVALSALAVSSLVCGALLIGTEPLVALSGQLVPAGRAYGLVLAAWAVALLPTLAYVALGLLLSVTTRSGIVGTLGPVVVALLMQLLALLGPGELVRALLISSPYDAWHTLFTADPAARPLLEGVVTSGAYIALFLGAAWLVLRRRTFAGTEAASSRHWRIQLRAVAAAAAVIVLLAAVSSWGPTAVTSSRLSAAITPTFERLAGLQYRWRTRQDPRNAAVGVRTSCRRSAGRPSRGPGDDWACVVHVVRPRVSGPGIGLEVTVRANGCYSAQAPPAIVGPQLLHDRLGATFVNPLYDFDGCLDAA